MIKEEFVLDGKHGKPILCDIRLEETGKPKPVIVFIHGFKGFKDWGHFNAIADYFANQGYVYVKLNLSHNGTSPEHPVDFVDLDAFGNNNFTIELDDVGVVMDYLFTKECICDANEMDLSRLCMIGHSRGGALALLKTAEDNRVKKVVTFAAIHDLEKRWPESFVKEWEEKGVQYVLNGRTNQQMPLYYQLVEDFIQHRERFTIPDRMKGIQVPILVTHGTEDATLDVSMARELASWNDKAELVIVDGADHVFGGGHPFGMVELPKHTTELLEETLKFLED